MKRMIALMVAILVILIVGCSSQQGENVATVRQILELAKEDKISGNLQVHLNGGVEAGLREGIYFGSTGSVVNADLSFVVEDIEDSAADSACAGGT